MTTVTTTTIKPINTPSYKLKAGLCKFCFCRSKLLTHTVKCATTKRSFRICTKCATKIA